MVLVFFCLWELIRKPDLTFLNSLRKTAFATLQSECESSKVRLSARLRVSGSGLYLLDSNQMSMRLRFPTAPWGEMSSAYRTPLVLLLACKWYSQKSPFYHLSARMTYTESSTGSAINLLAAAANTLFLLRQSYLDFEGKIIKLGWSVMWTNPLVFQGLPLCHQWHNPLQPWSCVDPWSSLGCLKIQFDRETSSLLSQEYFSPKQQIVG